MRKVKGPWFNDQIAAKTVGLLNFAQKNGSSKYNQSFNVEDVKEEANDNNNDNTTNNGDNNNDNSNHKNANSNDTNG